MVAPWAQGQARGPAPTLGHLRHSGLDPNLEDEMIILSTLAGEI